MWTSLLIAVISFVAMEAVAWATHRYLMHGPLWLLHASHHERSDGVELNDLFGVFFATVAIVLIVVGSEASIPGLIPFGAGMTAYGLVYLFMHDALVHGRFGRMQPPRHPYLKRVVQAHRLHHATHGQHGAYGFVWVPDGAERMPRDVSGSKKKAA